MSIRGRRSVAIDVDGIFTDFDAHWRQCAEHLLGRSLPQVSNDHSMHVRYALTRKEYDAVWHAYHADEWHRQPLYLHAANLVYALEDLGCMLWAVTNIDPMHQSARAESLHGLIPHERIVCVGARGNECVTPYAAKASALQNLGAVAFLDDHPANTNAAIGSVPLSVLLDRGYHGLEAPEYGVTVIDDPMDFPVLVEQFLKRTGRA